MADPLRLTLSGYTADIAKLPDGSVSVTVYAMFGSITVQITASEWQQIVDYVGAAQQAPE